MAKHIRCHDAIVLINSIVGSCIGNPDSDTHMTRAEVRQVLDIDIRKSKHEMLGEHYAQMEESHYYSFVEPTLYSQRSRIGPVGVECLELWYLTFQTFFSLKNSGTLTRYFVR